MADTVKKSRIVSEADVFDVEGDDVSPGRTMDEDASLHDLISHELNQRLNCMRLSDSISNGHFENNSVTITESTQHDDSDQPDFISTTTTTTAANNITTSAVTISETLNFDSPEECQKEVSTARDRMFLSTDTACILFTQTVVQSPMLTPTDDTYDFIAALAQRDNKTPTDLAPKFDDSVNSHESENSDGVAQKSRENSQDFDPNITLGGISQDFINNELKHAETTQPVTTDSELDLNTSENSQSVELLENSHDSKCDEHARESREIEQELYTNTPDTFENVPEIYENLTETCENLSEINESETQLHVHESPVHVHESEFNVHDNESQFNVHANESQFNVQLHENDTKLNDNNSNIYENDTKLNEKDEIEARLRALEAKIKADQMKKENEKSENVIEIITVEEITDVRDLNEEDIPQIVCESPQENDESFNQNYEINLNDTDELVSTIDETLNECKVLSNKSESIEKDMGNQEIFDVANVEVVEITDDDENKQEMAETEADLLEYSVISPQELERQESENSPQKDEFETAIRENYEIIENAGSDDVKIFVTETEDENELSDEQVMIGPNEKETESCQNLENLDDFENVDTSDETTNFVCPNTVSSTTKTETTFVETTTNSTPEKVLKKKKSKKSKKDSEKENISVCDDVNITNDENFSHVSVKNLKSSFSKFDALSKKTVLHVRSSDSGKAQEKFNGTIATESNCKSCGKQVFQMEQIKAEKALWHKNCFRCHECNKQLNVDTYQSNEGVLYCKPHFKALFAPKVVEDDQPLRPRKHELIIRENQPEELPPDVVRASDKPDLGLDELQNLNVKERFQVFEHHQDNEQNLERTPSTVNVKRSPSILSKLAKFQAKGMDIGVGDDSLNGVPVEESSSESEEEDDGIEGEDAELVRARRAQREKPLHFTGMSDVLERWEAGGRGAQSLRDERREERKQEIQSIRSRLFMGKQGKMKELYQQAVAESETGPKKTREQPNKMDAEVVERTRAIKEKFEQGEPLTGDEQHCLKELEEDRAMFDSAITKKSRSIFLEMDANATKAPSGPAPLTVSPSGAEVRRAREAFMSRTATSEEVVRASDTVDDVRVETADISNRFKFFERYRAPEPERKPFRITPPRDGQVKMSSPEREIYRDPDVVRSSPPEDDTALPLQAHTTTKMLSIFRQMESTQREPQPVPAGPKPLKRFTPPPEPAGTASDSGSEEEEASSSEAEPDSEDGDAGGKLMDAGLLEAQRAARAKKLRDKFERWEANEIRREQSTGNVLLGDGQDSQIESAKSLRARFESMREQSNEKERTPRVKVHRFVDPSGGGFETCKGCEGRVYPLEKIACHNNVYHKNCFRCRECHTVLRMDSYTYNQGLLYCVPHFKRLFIANGNYETGFGLDQPKGKWNTPT